MGVSPPAIKDRFEAAFDVRDIELGGLNQGMIDTVNGLIPTSCFVLCGVPFLQCLRMMLEIGLQLRIGVQLDEPCLIPWIHQVVARPIECSAGGIFSDCEL